MRCLFRISLVVTLLLFTNIHCVAQEENDRGSSEFKEYDKSHISPELRRKHSISIGGQNAFSTPWSSNFKTVTSISNKIRINYNMGFHVGYNYLILKRRNRALNPGGKMITEIKNGIGVHFAMQFQRYRDEDDNPALYKEAFFNVSYYRPLIKLYIPIFRFYLLNEFGLGFHYNPRFKDTETGAFSPVVTFEPVRIRLFNSPIYIYGTTAYALRNNSFNTLPLDISFLVGAKVYFYKY